MKINLTKTEEVKKALQEIQKLSRVRVVEVEQITAAVKEIEEKIKVVPKTHRSGVIAIIDINAQTFPKSYNGLPESTIIQIEFFASGWFITNIFRGRCEVKKYRLFLNDRAKEDIIAHISSW